MYSAVSLDSLLPLLSTDAPGAGVAEKRRALRAAYREFCDRSRIWRERLRIENIAGAVRSAPLLPAYSDSEAKTLLGAVRTVYRLWQDEKNVSRRGDWGLYPYEDAQKFLSFQAAPYSENSTQTWNLTADVIVLPLPDADSGPDFILDDYAEGIAAGALARLVRRPRQPYSDREGVAEFRREFRREISRACLAAQQAEAPAWGDTVTLPDTDLGWTVPDGEIDVRDLSSPEALNMNQWMQAFRTLVEDLKTRGVV